MFIKSLCKCLDSFPLANAIRTWRFKVLPHLDLGRIIDSYFCEIYSADPCFETEANICAWSSIFERN